jgi:hypothetical protein
MTIMQSLAVENQPFPSIESKPLLACILFFNYMNQKEDI